MHGHTISMFKCFRLKNKKKKKKNWRICTTFDDSVPFTYDICMHILRNGIKWATAWIKVYKIEGWMKYTKQQYHFDGIFNNFFFYFYFFALAKYVQILFANNENVSVDTGKHQPYKLNCIQLLNDYIYFFFKKTFHSIWSQIQTTDVSNFVLDKQNERAQNHISICNERNLYVL